MKNGTNQRCNGAVVSHCTLALFTTSITHSLPAVLYARWVIRQEGLPSLYKRGVSFIGFNKGFRRLIDRVVTLVIPLKK